MPRRYSDARAAGDKNAMLARLDALEAAVARLTSENVALRDALAGLREHKRGRKPNWLQTLEGMSSDAQPAAD